MLNRLEGLGELEITWLIVLLIVAGAVMVGTVTLILFLTRRKNSNAGMKKCAFCAELIQGEARICRFCGRELAQ